MDNPEQDVSCPGYQKPPGILLQELLTSFRQQHPRHAMGGWWALAGFSFQTSIFLLHFFEQLQSGSTEPGQLAEMEQLSDILYPKDTRLVLIQVKRTLSKTTLISAAKEFYLIMDFCRKTMPSFIDKLQFQIACQTKTPSLTLDALSPSDIEGAGNNPETWKSMLNAFDVKQPIIEECDPIGQLHVFLWTKGVQNPTLLIERCAGRLLQSFNVTGPEETTQIIQQVGRDLSCYFHDVYSS